MSTKGKNEREVRLSKKLSYLLRHGAVKERLHINSEGFVPVNELLNHKSLDRCTIDDIKWIVANNDKHRFFLKETNGILEIRANQGHSINQVNELSLTVLKDVDFDIVHGTYFDNWKSIKINGLSRMNRNHIHFSKGVNFICGLRRSAQVHIYIDFEKAKRDGLMFQVSENNVVLCPGNANGIVEPKYFLKVVSKTGQTLFPEH